MSLVFNLTLFLIFLVFLYFLIKKDFKLVFLYGLLVFQGITIIPSLIYIEEGIYISEQGRESFFVGATLAYIIYFVLTFSLIFFTFRVLKNVKMTTVTFNVNKKPIDSYIIYYIVLLVLLVLFINLSQSKSPLFDSSISRFNYWKNSRFPFLNNILGNTSAFIPFILGILYNSNKLKSIVLLLLYFVYNFFIGQKFSPIVSGLFSFFLPIVIVSNLKFNFRNFFNKKIIISFLIIFGISYYVIYKRYEQRSPYAIVKIYDPNEAMFYRIFGLQGHLMWGSIESYVYNNQEHSYNFSELYKGMHHLMYKFSGTQKGLENDINSGFSFTNGYPSILFKVFPISIALVVHVFFVIFILATLGWMLFRFLKSKSFLLAVISYQLFNWTIYAFTMGYLYKLKYTLFFLIFYGLFIVINNKIKPTSKL